MDERIGRLTVIAACVLAASAVGQQPGPLVLPADALLTTPGIVVSKPVPSAPTQPAKTVVPGTLSAPTSPVAPAEPKASTLEELGKKVEILGKNLTVVTGDGDFKLVLGGAIVADFLYNTARPVSPGTPFFLAPDSPFGFNNRTFDATARQTSLFGLFTGPDVHDFKSGGMVLVNLYDNSVIKDRYGLLPILAYGDLKNEEWRIAAGLQFDVFNPLNPTVLPFSLLATSGNTGMYRGQLRLERYLHPDNDTQVTLTGAIGEPLPTIVSDVGRVSEDNGLPNLEGRAAIGFGARTGQGLESHQPIEIGVSGICGELRTTLGADRVVARVWGLGVDARWAIDDRCGLQGEAYTGQGMGTYGTSAFQNVNPTTFRAVRAHGFWVEGYYYWCPEEVHSHFGYGMDDPLNRDAGLTIPHRNETFYATTIWDVNKGFRVAFELSYLKTTYQLPLKDNSGLVFQTQFQWKF